MSKMGSYCSFGHLKHKLWPKEGSGVKLSIWLPTRKSQESTRFTCLQTTCHIPWKALDESYNFNSDYTSIRGLLAKLWESRLARFRDSHAGVPGEKSHLDVGRVERSKLYYKGEGGGFPQVRAVVSLLCQCCSWLILAPKVFQLCASNLVWVVCRPVWVSEVCQLFLVPSRRSNTPLYPSKCCELGTVPWLLSLPLSFT
jgi:hypothetical protein